MFFTKPKKKRIYLDHAAATPIHPQVKEVMLPFWEDTFGNPSAVHFEGVQARQAVESAREKVASILGIKASEVVFTSGGTESNNLAILGFVENLHNIQGLAYKEIEIITTKIEHPSITELLPLLINKGAVIKYVPIDSEGKVTVEALSSVLSSRTKLITFAYANSEVGTVQAVSRLARVVRKYERENNTKISLHIDAAQAPLWLPCELERLGVDMMSLDVGKCNGPKGVGILANRSLTALSPILYGGGQESGLRPGTENVAGIVGAAKALEIAQVNYSERAKKVQAIREAFIVELQAALPEALLNGPDGENRLPNNINISLPKLDTEFAVIYLDTNGISVSTKSACAGADGGESAVVLAMTGNSERAKSTLRLSLGEETTKSDMQNVLVVLVKYFKKMNNLTN